MLEAGAERNFKRRVIPEPPPSGEASRRPGAREDRGEGDIPTDKMVARGLLRAVGEMCGKWSRDAYGGEA